MRISDDIVTHGKVTGKVLPMGSRPGRCHRTAVAHAGGSLGRRSGHLHFKPNKGNEDCLISPYHDSSHVNTDGELRSAWFCLKRAG